MVPTQDSYSTRPRIFFTLVLRYSSRLSRLGPRGYLLGVEHLYRSFHLITQHSTLMLESGKIDGGKVSSNSKIKIDRPLKVRNTFRYRFERGLEGTGYFHAATAMFQKSVTAFTRGVD